MDDKSNLRVWRWQQYAIMAGAPVVAGLLGWQLQTLDPRRYCQTTFDFAKVTSVADVINALKVCNDLQKLILNIKDHAIIGLIVILGVGYLMLMARFLGMQAALEGPLGMKAKLGRDSAAEGAKEVKEVVDQKVEEISAV
jgi:hypothetical protein